MVNHNLIAFIESYNSRDREHDYKRFTVNVEFFYKNNLLFLPSFERYDTPTITLDEEDLKYLYDKYYRDYQININERAKEKEERKRKEIKKLEEQLNKLKNDTIHSSKL